MAHRDRGGVRGDARGDWDRPERDDRSRREPREPNRDRDRERRDQERDRERDVPRGLNEYFVNGEGIHREVMQREICKYLGPEAYSKPGVYNGINGYIVTAVRTFTPKMIDDLQTLSREYISENQNSIRRGYEGIPYAQSMASRQFDSRMDGNMMGSPDVYNDPRYNQSQPNYSSGGAQPGYLSSANYPIGANMPSSQIPGYEAGPGYSQVPSYAVGSNYPQVSGYPPASVYPTASGYTTTGYAAPAGRHGNMNEQNYLYNAPSDYSNQNNQYRQQNPFPNGSRPGEPMTDPTRAGPRFQQFVTSPGENSIRGAYDGYGQQIAPGQPTRGAFAAAPRGTPTGYDGQPLDGGHTLEERRRR